MPKNIAFVDDLLNDEIAEAHHHDEPEERDPLEALLDDGTLVEVIGQLKSGKEGTVFSCRAHPRLGFDLVAAKVFRAREHRTFRNQSLYREGAIILNKRDERALNKKTAWGKQVETGTWMYHEFEVLRALSGAGADVPRPITMAERVLLMEYIGDEDGPAPKLQETRLEAPEARSLFTRVMRNVELFLSLDYVHGDLSPYNVLYWRGGVTVIDFPQAVDPRTNHNAFALLTRDIGNVCRYFRRYGIEAEPETLARRLWGRYQRAEL